ncbi:MAG: hypothetical protein QM758_24460 [Armatimonas sp.]
MIRKIVALTCFAGIALVSGCGGGGEDTETNTDTGTRVQVRVRWPELGRTIHASPYANSVRITLTNARLVTTDSQGQFLGKDIVYLINRPSDSASEQAYTIPDLAKPGKLFTYIETFSEANQQGRQLQSTEASVYPDESGFLPDLDLRAGFGAVRTAQIDIAGSAVPATTVTEIKVGQDIYITPRLNWNSAQGLTAYYRDFKWTISYPEAENSGFARIIPQNDPQPQHIFVADRSGLVNLSMSIDGVQANTLQFRAVP